MTTAVALSELKLIRDPMQLYSEFHRASPCDEA